MNFLLILAFLAGNVVKFSHISPLDLSVGILWLIKLPVIIKRKHILFKYIIGFEIVCIISLLISFFLFTPIQIGYGAMYLLRFIIYSTLLGVGLQSNKLIPILGIGTAIIGLLQYLLYPDTRALSAYGWDPHYYRLIGSLMDPGFTGIILVLTLIFIVINKFNKIWWIIVYLALALTYSRSSYLAFFTAFSWISYQRKTWKYFLVSASCVLLTVIFLPRWSDGEGVKLERTSSVWARIESWKTAWKIFTDHPLTGVGFNNYRFAQKASPESHAGSGSDSSILLVMATTGVVGLVFYLKYLKKLWILSRDNLIFSASLVAIFVHSWFLNSLFYPSIMLWLVLLIPG